MNEIPCVVRRSRLTWRTRVYYACPKCNERLGNPLRMAGKIDACPACYKEHKVPGVAARREAEQAKQERDVRARASWDDGKRKRKEQIRAVVSVAVNPVRFAKALSVLCLLGSVAAFVIVARMEVSVPVPNNSLGIGPIANLDLLLTRQGFVVTGGVLLIASVILGVGSMILSGIERLVTDDEFTETSRENA